MAEPPVHHFPGRDGLELAYRETGSGRPVVLLHGFTSTGPQWIHHGPAAVLAEHGYRVILPDLRGHGDSSRPHDPACYPPDALVDDGLALIDWLGLEDYDLGGYSLGGRIVLRMLVRGARPARAIVAGQGLDAINTVTSRTGRYRRVLSALADQETIAPGSPEEELAHWINQLGGDPRALRHVLDTLVATPNTALDQVTAPTLVAVGNQDNSHSTAQELAAALPDARFARVPGDHFTAFTSPELAAAVLAFLNDHPHRPTS
ncbi:alpha/beta fold hydrolase [Streptomyces sp. RPT161]|uniref:alpha/beta fold hydrolase n=1 Tax=Streptomyces sp. RPT161 TaxID=3015993 RepID=UPI0022B887B6|nr:alpha/beta hydrolase [Streptomyces sp. RPT161]